jgi:tagatose 1,6-diphosphate aldolase GatY/KbaY
MLAAVRLLLEQAERGRYAVGAFNVYNLEGVQAVIGAAEQERSPAILQVHPAALKHGGDALLALCLAAARSAGSPIAVHLDHGASENDIRIALAAGLTSVMADGSQLTYAKNVAFSRAMADLAHAQGATIEAELGRLAGTEDDLTVEAYAAHFTDPDQAREFALATGVDALAVCIGNVHGRYAREPSLDFDRLAALRRLVPVALVLHGASGLSPALVERAIELGVCKFNVNTELRQAYLSALRGALATAPAPDLLDVLRAAVRDMQSVVADKLQLFGSIGRA